MMPALPALNLSSSSSVKGGDISAPSNVYFGGFGAGSGGGGADLGGLVMQYWPALAVGAVLLMILRRRK